MKSIGVIPARYGSTRFEGKPLAEINTKPMIEWVYKRALKSKLDKVVIATDDARIFNAVKNFGGEAILTSACHKSGTDRIAEVVKKESGYDVVINIQGDEPLIEPRLINELIESFEDESVDMSTFKMKIEDEDELCNPNAVKVVTDKSGFALYFSRSPIPYNRIDRVINYYRHIGIYGYRTSFLMEFSNLPATFLEETESLEQLRALENGYKIKVLETQFSPKGVDTIEDLEEIREYVNINKIGIE